MLPVCQEKWHPVHNTIFHLHFSGTITYVRGRIGIMLRTLLIMIMITHKNGSHALLILIMNITILTAVSAKGS